MPPQTQKTHNPVAISYVSTIILSIILIPLTSEWYNNRFIDGDISSISLGAGVLDGFVMSYMFFLPLLLASLVSNIKKSVSLSLWGISPFLILDIISYNSSSKIFFTLPIIGLLLGFSIRVVRNKFSPAS